MKFLHRFIWVYICVWSLLPTFAVGTELIGKVVRIADGDTITVLDSGKQQHRIRLAAIDAPEKHQAFGSKSKENLTRLVHSRVVRVQIYSVDRYHREVGKVMIGDVDVNLEQIKAGLAWHYKRYANEQVPSDRVIYADAERRAQMGRIGLWRDSHPEPPWLFRRIKH